jgi:hypothetical protein
MRASRGLMLSALCSWTLIAWTTVSVAQIRDPSNMTFDFSADATYRSPRLLGMGRLTLPSDVHNGVNLWDLSANPIGLFESDSTSSFDLRPATSSAAARHTPVGSDTERQHLAGREVRVGYEAWKRGDTSIYGIAGDVSNVRSDQPFSDTRVQRDVVELPRFIAILNGRMPRFQSDRMLYELHLFNANANTIEEYRKFFTNAEGEYLGRESEIVPPPNFFDPDEYRVSAFGGGAGLSYRIATWMTLAVGGEATDTRIEGENSDNIHETGTGQDRSYYTGRLGVTGHPVKGLEYALDGRTWSAGNQERFVFTLKAGQNQSPFSGRGKVLDREEDGQEGRGRVRWTLGKLELNAGGRTWSRDVDITPPPTGQVDSYNYFLNVAANRLGADSLALPDSVVRSSQKDEGWDIGYGATWRLGTKGLVGAEYHFAKQSLQLKVFENQAPPSGGSDPVSFVGDGPHRRTSDIRAGFEYACTEAFTGRLGFIRQSDDLDELTERNEFKSNTLTTGFGIHPLGSRWTADFGWAIEWISPDYEDATDSKESRQQLAAQIRWAF